MDEIACETVFDLEYFFELSPDLLCVAGYDGYFKKINPAVSETLGYSNEELFARPINSFVHPADQQVTEEKREGLQNDSPLLNFENRYITKTGEVVWLYWTSMPIKRDKVVFAIAKNITHKRKLAEYWRISDYLDAGLLTKHKRFKYHDHSPQNDGQTVELPATALRNEPSLADQIWLQDFEKTVRKYIGSILNISLLSNELAISERALFRRVKAILGLTPNRLVRIIRLQVAWEAIGTGKFRTVAELSTIAGFQTPAYFSKIFEQIYGLRVLDLIK